MDRDIDDIPIDEKAQRILNLLFVLNSTTRPLTTEEIVSDSDLGYGYQPGKRNSVTKKFKRDREDLAEQGIFIKEVKTLGASENEESSWELDRTSTFVGGLISIDDAENLLRALNAELSRPGTPFALALRRIKAKTLQCLKRDAQDSPCDENPAMSTQNIEEAVWIAFSLRRKLKITYVNAAGEESKRTICVYGMFSNAGEGYVTALDERDMRIKTFRIDRIRKTGKPKEPYSIPSDFDIREYLFFQFDFSNDSPIPASFSFPTTTSKDEIRPIVHNRGTLQTRSDGSCIWSVEVRDIESAAHYALAHANRGMRPVSPQSLIDAWNTAIEKTVSSHGA